MNSFSLISSRDDYLVIQNPCTKVLHHHIHQMRASSPHFAETEILQREISRATHMHTQITNGALPTTKHKLETLSPLLMLCINYFDLDSQQSMFFRALCARPVGPTDRYLALTQLVSTLVQCTYILVSRTSGATDAEKFRQLAANIPQQWVAAFPSLTQAALVSTAVVRQIK